jgi:hypothetical protein
MVLVAAIAIYLTENIMQVLLWLIDNFGWFFGPVFLLYMFLIIRRLVHLYDLLRHISPGKQDSDEALVFLMPLFTRLNRTGQRCSAAIDPLIDAIWAELEGRITIHFAALQGYVNTLVLIGFAGTICGAIGAFNEMFKGLAGGQAATTAFIASWNNGLATALYTSLGAAAIGSVVITLVGSRWLMQRAKRLETIVALKIADTLEEASHEPSSSFDAVAA